MVDFTSAVAELQRSGNEIETKHQGDPIWSHIPLSTLHGKYDSPTMRKTSLGKGGYAEVILMESICSKSVGTLVAVKSFYREKQETLEHYCDRVFWEFSLGVSLVHENINQTISLHHKNKGLHQVMKYCPQGSLKSILRNNPPLQPTLESWAKQLLRGVEFLHDQGITHRDIKSENILLADDGFIKIIDFGLAQMFKDGLPGLTLIQKVPTRSPEICLGTCPYQPPECFVQGCDIDHTKQDIWSCGVTLLTFWERGRVPWGVADPRMDKSYRKMRQGWTRFLKQRKSENQKVDVFDRPYCGPIFEKLPTRFQECCLLKMLHPQPRERISIKEALQEHWIKGIPDRLLATCEKIIERRRL